METLVIISVFVAIWICYKILEYDEIWGAFPTPPIIKHLSLIEIAFAVIMGALTLLIAAATGSKLVSVIGLVSSVAWAVVAFWMYLGSQLAMRVFRIANVMRLIIPVIGWLFTGSAWKMLKQAEEESPPPPSDSVMN